MPKMTSRTERPGVSVHYLKSEINQNNSRSHYKDQRELSGKIFNEWKGVLGEVDSHPRESDLSSSKACSSAELAFLNEGGKRKALRSEEDARAPFPHSTLLLGAWKLKRSSLEKAAGEAGLSRKSLLSIREKKSGRASPV